MGFQAIFNFVIRNPPMALIAGAVLSMFMATSVRPFDPLWADNLLEFFWPLFYAGVLLQVLWLVMRRR